MAQIERDLVKRDLKIGQKEVTPRVNQANKEVPIKGVFEIGGRVEIPVSWDSGCRL